MFYLNYKYISTETGFDVLVRLTVIDVIVSLDYFSLEQEVLVGWLRIPLLYYSSCQHTNEGVPTTLPHG